MTNAELKIILNNHQHWLNEDVEGWENMFADLHEADLCGANLYGVNLHGADLHGAKLCRANLRGTNLYGANLYGADLYEADLCGAFLCGANLREADLRKADLCGVDLCRADLREANLCGADLHEADLCGANLYGVNLHGADLHGADLHGANLYGTNLCKAFIPMSCPDTGSFIAWKKANNYIVKLLIPEDALRSSATGRKCRANKALVIEIQNIDKTPSDLTEIKSNFCSDFVYRVGEIVYVDNFDTDRFNECAPGIHFFINRQEAVDY